VKKFFWLGSTMTADLLARTACLSKLDNRGEWCRDECSEKRSAALKLDMSRDALIGSGAAEMASASAKLEPLDVAFRKELTEKISMTARLDGRGVAPGAREGRDDDGRCMTRRNLPSGATSAWASAWLPSSENVRVDMDDGDGQSRAGGLVLKI
jgi:hypothetical protein